MAPLDEPKPDKNHIHIKGRIVIEGGDAESEYVLVEDAFLVAGVKVDDENVISRKELIEAINEETGLGLQYR